MKQISPREKLDRAVQFAMANRPKVGGFPFLAECMRVAGVTHNVWTLPAAQSIYMIDGVWIVSQGTPLVAGMASVATFDKESLVRAIRLDQSGASTFQEFLMSAWEAGVVSYDVDFERRTVTYMGMGGELYVEPYPEVEVPELVF